jgi:hypothetical protein
MGYVPEPVRQKGMDDCAEEQKRGPEIERLLFDPVAQDCPQTR